MSIRTLLNSRTSTPTHRRPNRRRPLASRLCLESLEDRCLLSFSPAVSYPVGENPQAVVTGDFNGDGRLDLAVANSSSNTVSLLLGNAGGTFQAARNVATGIGPISVAVGDFNKDGKLDLATGNALDVSVLLGNGNGTFGTPSNTSLGMQEHSVAVGDFNGDGKLDLGVASSLFQQGSPGDPYYGGYPSFYLNYAPRCFLATAPGRFRRWVRHRLATAINPSAAPPWPISMPTVGTTSSLSTPSNPMVLSATTQRYSCTILMARPTAGRPPRSDSRLRSEPILETRWRRAM
jgi:hypothetical protein